ncbi:hypothetical protein MSAS_18680 [Mycobacterium saskatchewanense]|uniref:Uncharacterized protein n=1 Tax=Mycobacterium saskatchewanense TaxID=220927 RepID=A0AAJ3TUW5_9MYCO|nr:hypothetical protein [Mycobacterium saskatchewanense]ORW71131.1 hypothetical protein AWC23_01040 [Mycobacterium saskatchewanense]BBX62694.1 hypothetical protein MSAS_18680 [Mycobacterium saskatchewanense]
MATVSRLRTPLCVIALAGVAAFITEPAAAADPPAPACKPGFVWRAARPGDAVCVTPEIRDKTAQENAAAAQNVQPGGGNACKSGFVWRNAYPGDAVCVTPDMRDQAAADNQAASSRTVATADTCQKWRGATDELILAEDNGYKVFAYTSLTGQASFEGHGGPEVKGTITTPGGINGNAISFNVNWNNGWHSRYIGNIHPDGSARGGYEDFGPPNDSDVHSGNWDSVAKFICDQ